MPFAEAATPFKVVIDPGHGGKDSGAVAGSIHEADLVFKIAKQLEAKLGRYPGISVEFTRSEDQFINIFQRTEKINALQPDLVVSIHANSSDDKNVRGAEIYMRNLLPPDEYSLFLANRENQSTGVVDSQQENRKWLSATEDVKNIVRDLKREHTMRNSALLAEIIYKNWPLDSHKNHKMIRQAPFFVISQVDMPALLIEIGYVTNRHEAALLSEPATQDKLAEGLQRAVLKYKEIVDKN